MPTLPNELPSVKNKSLSTLNFFITLSITPPGPYHFQPCVIIIRIPHSTVSSPT